MTAYTEDRYYAFPAVIDDSEDAKGDYTVTFPDVPGAYGYGTGIAQAITSGKEGLEGILINSDKKFTSSTLEEIQKANPGKIVSYITADMLEAKAITKPVMVKKNTSIPRDLALKGEKMGINFSKVLTDALRVKLG
ncbi:type II toxin-antitoxin system HicB family antitoxin [Lactobacillus sp. ESL0684]|uniref:type II toxin-antitoxin system HicB family antitoxin n=1 Tax=unclassified Lactobacillus TaxID=2620435 RepID=UPI0023F77656|nr:MULTISPECIES: type II toxin-antitoxin system HicB family antitoxin [unclassified Lactobacillus]WEV39739.1 type II toxin-antitoxin system HicB family antitoxin [Lactobacillus sp. ESL0681]WEV43727.1 type II toxin-antitoxin system HicB family antitoxin [Lactobacillus sp. ESL0684]